MRSAKTIATNTTANTTRNTQNTSAGSTQSSSTLGIKAQLRGATFAEGEALLKTGLNGGATADAEKAAGEMKEALALAIGGVFKKKGAEALTTRAGSALPFLPAAGKVTAPTLAKDLGVVWTNGKSLLKDPTSYSEFDAKKWQIEADNVFSAILAATDLTQATYLAASMSLQGAVRTKMAAGLAKRLEIGDFSWVSGNDASQIISTSLRQFPLAWVPFIRTISPAVILNADVIRNCPDEHFPKVIERALGKDSGAMANPGAKAAITARVTEGLLGSNQAVLSFYTTLVRGCDSLVAPPTFKRWLTVARANPEIWPTITAGFSAAATRTWWFGMLPAMTTDLDTAAALDAMRGFVTDTTQMYELLGRRFGVVMAATTDSAGKPILFDFEVLGRLWDTLGQLPLGHITDVNFTRIVRTGFSGQKELRAGDNKPIVETPEQKKHRATNRVGGGMWREGGGLDLSYNKDTVETMKLTDSASLGAFKYTAADVEKAVAAKERALNADTSLTPANRVAQLKAYKAEEEAKVVDFGEANAFDHTVRHEIGHSIDSLLHGTGVDVKGPNFAAWKRFDNAGLFYEALLAGDSSGAAKWKAAQAALTDKTAFAKALNGDPSAIPSTLRTLFGAKMKELEGTLIWQTLKTFEYQVANFNRNVPAVGGRQYTFDDGKGYLSYSASARQNQGVSAYQWKNHREWFAEVYAYYYDDPKTPGGTLARRDPKTKAWLDENVDKKGQAPGGLPKAKTDDKSKGK